MLAICEVPWWRCFGFLAVGMVLTFAYWGFVGTFVVVGVQLLRWQIKFSDLLTIDPDYHKAKRSKNISFVLFLVAAPVGLLMNPFWDLILSELGMLTRLPRTGLVCLD